MATRIDLSDEEVRAAIAEIDKQFQGTATDPIDARIAERNKQPLGSISEAAKGITKTKEAEPGLKKLAEGGEIAAEAGEAEVAGKGLKDLVDGAIHKASEIRSAAGLTPSKILSANGPLEAVHHALDLNKDGKLTGKEAVNSILGQFDLIELPTTEAEETGKKAEKEPLRGMPPALAKYDVASSMPPKLAMKDGKGYWQRYVEKQAEDKSKPGTDKSPKK